MSSGSEVLHTLSGQAQIGFGVRGHFDFAAQGFAA